MTRTPFSTRRGCRLPSTGPSGSHPRRGAAFTLVELLVVIGIIAVLVSILLPTISAAQRQSQMVKCSSNLRQLASACLLHAGEHKGFLPLAGPILAQAGGAAPLALAWGLNDTYKQRYSYVRAPGVGSTGQDMIMPLPAALSPYLGIKDVPTHDWNVLDKWLNDNRGVWKMFICPSSDAYQKPRANSVDNTPAGQGTVLAVAMSYTSGYSTVWSTNTDYAINEGAFAYSANPAHEKRFLRGNLNRLRKTSQLVLFTDARPRKAPDPALFGFQDPWITWSPKVAATCSLGDVMLENGKAVDRTMFDPYRHKNRVNVAFADAHVEALNITAMDLSKAYLLPPP